MTELFKQLSINLATNTEVKPLSPNDPPIQIVRPEFLRRMSEMQHMMHMARGEQDDMFKDSHSVIVNSNHPTIAQKLVAMEDESTKQQLATANA